MIDPENVTQVSPEETLARYVLYRSHIRTSSQTLKPDAFIPHPYQNLSVTRHISADEADIWDAGDIVASARKMHLYGRGDIPTRVCIEQLLQVIAAPVPGNPNHAEITNWPQEKPAQKVIAQELAAVSCFLPRR